MNDHNMFEDIALIDDVLHPPIGGVPAAALSSVSWGTHHLKLIGQPPIDGRSGWKRELKVKITLEEIRNRDNRPVTEHLVSQEINGKLVTGYGLLDHDELVEALSDQGYELKGTNTIKDFRVERFSRPV